MRKLILVSAISLAFALPVMAGGKHTPPNMQQHLSQHQSQGQAQLQGQAQGQSQNALGSATINDHSKQYLTLTPSAKSDSTALAGASGGHSKASVGDTSATGGNSDAKSVSGDSVSSSGSAAYSGASSSGSTSDNEVTVSSFHQGDRYPDIPVNAGVVFASVCQEGSSATNSKINIALVTDSSFCNRLTLADAYRTMFSFYSEKCNTDLRYQYARIRDHHLIEATAKGKISPLTESDYDEDPVSCDHAEDYRVKMADELDKAQKMLDRTSATGLVAKWATQLGIPVSLAYVIFAVL